MKKQEFLSKLREGLSGLPQESVEERLLFYGEIIDDKIEDGLSEEDALAQIGTVQEVVSQILFELPLVTLAKERIKPKRALKMWEIILLALGSPIWLSLLIAALSVGLSMYIVLWVVLVSLWAVELALGCGALSGIVYTVVFSIQSKYWQGLLYFGAGLALVGLSILLFFACKQATGGVLLLTRKTAVGMKRMFVWKKVKK